MNDRRKYAAICGALFASSIPAPGDGGPAAITPAWEVHADLSGEGLPAKLRGILLPNAPKLGASPSLTIRGFDNLATADKDWLVSLDVPGRVDRIWENLQRDLGDEWGSPDESGRWFVNDPDSGEGFVIIQAGESLKFSNAAENLSVTMASVETRPAPGRAIHGYVNLRAPGAERESKLFRLAESATFSAGSLGDGMVLDITVALIEVPATDRIEQAVRESLDSKLLDQLTPFLPKPVLTRDSTDEHERFTFTMEFDAAQTDRMIAAVIDRLMEGEARDPQPQPATASDDSDATSR